MATDLVLVNGLPGSGKSTLARGLASALDAPMLSKDIVKESLGTLLPDAMAVPALGAIAMDVVWQLAAALAALVVVESWWYRVRDLQHVEEGLRAADAHRAVEIWCDVPAELARARYARRARPAMYDDARHLAEDWPAWAAHGVPLALTPVLRVDTARAVEYPRWLATCAPRSVSSGRAGTSDSRYHHSASSLASMARAFVRAQSGHIHSSIRSAPRRVRVRLQPSGGTPSLAQSTAADRSHTAQ